MARYPQLGNSGKLKGSGYINLEDARCSIVGCAKLATHFQRIEFSWFRGDDEMYPLCGDHCQLPRQNLKMFFKRLSDAPKEKNDGTKDKN